MVSDIDTSWSLTELFANWAPAPADPNSGTVAYWYAVGTTFGGNDVIDWTVNGGSTNIHLTGLSLTDQQIYYVSVKAENGADLLSNFICSNGQVAALPVSAQITEKESPVNVFPNPSNGIITIETGAWNEPGLTISIVSPLGKTIVVKDASKTKTDSRYTYDLKSLKLSSGYYIVKLNLNGQSMEIPVNFLKE
jgi:hypothetical protein